VEVVVEEEEVWKVLDLEQEQVEEEYEGPGYVGIQWVDSESRNDDASVYTVVGTVLEEVEQGEQGHELEQIY